MSKKIFDELVEKNDEYAQLLKTIKSLLGDDRQFYKLLSIAEKSNKRLDIKEEYDHYDDISFDAITMKDK